MSTGSGDMSSTRAMRYDSIIFDLDGTLWDAAATSARGWNQALQSSGMAHVHVSADDIRSVSGRPFDECVRTLLPDVSASKPDVLHTLDTHEQALIERDGGRLYDGVLEGIELLSQRFRLFLISNCQAWYLDAFWAQFGLTQFFSGWNCHGTSGVPKAAMLQQLVSTYGLKSAIYVGDTEGDWIAAQGADMDFGHAAYGFGSVAQAATVFASFANLAIWFNTAPER